MTRRFNTVGACNPKEHYVLDAKERLSQVKALVDQSGCFWLYGPSQTGKTTVMQLWAMELTKRGKYAALLVSAASLAGLESDKWPYKAPNEWSGRSAIVEDAFLYELRAAAHRLPEDCQPPDWGYQVAGQRIRAALAAWANVCPRPLVLFIDDVDTLRGRSLLFLLRQLASGLNQRPQPFPQSIALMALQDLNYWSGDELDVKNPDKNLAGDLFLPTPGGVFHGMRTATLELQFFSLEEVANVYQKHTNATGQLFTLEAVDRAFEVTQGQPWLVNAIAQYAVAQTEDPIEPHHIESAAAHILCQSSINYPFPLDHLPARLQQFQAILEPVLTEKVLRRPTNQQIQMVVATGICRFDAAGGLVISNPLYRDVILRQLAMPAIASLGSIKSTWITLDGTVNVQQVWDAFVTLWQSQGDALMQTVIYESIAPYMAVMAFCHRLTAPHGVLNAAYRFQDHSMSLTLQMVTPSQSLVLLVQVIVWSEGNPEPLELGLSRLEHSINQEAEDPVSLSANLSETPETPYACLIMIDQRCDRLSCHERTRLDSASTSTGLTVSVIHG
ncbi:MAG: ATP-binding protein [Cyanobacteria bacterium P01_F01_bin.150]